MVRLRRGPVRRLPDPGSALARGLPESVLFQSSSETGTITGMCAAIGVVISPLSTPSLYPSYERLCSQPPSHCGCGAAVRGQHVPAFKASTFSALPPVAVSTALRALSAR